MKKALPITYLITIAQFREAASHRINARIAFCQRLATTFPALYRHPELRGTREIDHAHHTWIFAFGGLTIEVMEREQGGWGFTAFAGDTCVYSREARGYWTPIPSVALLCFMGEAMAKAAACEMTEEGQVAA